MILYTKSQFGAISVRRAYMYKKLRNFGTVPPGVTNLVSKCAGNSKENCHTVSRQELCALLSNRAKYRGGGGHHGPPPPVFLGLTFYGNGMSSYLFNYVQRDRIEDIGTVFWAFKLIDWLAKELCLKEKK